MPGPARTFVTKRLHVLLLAGPVFLLFGIACIWLWDSAAYVRTGDARVRAQMIAISAEASGRIVDRPARAGAIVEMGELLARLDSREAVFALAATELEQQALILEISSQRIRAASLRDATASRLGAQQSGLAASAADLRAAQAELAIARAEHERFQRLRAAGLVTQPDAERAQTSLEQAVQATQHAKSTFAASRASVNEAAALLEETGAADTDLEAMTIAAAALDQQIALSRLALERHTITSPVRGVIDDVFVEAGEWVQPGMRIALMHDPASVWIEANIKETSIRRVRPGAHAAVEFDAWPGRSFAAKVESVSDAAASEFALIPVVNPTGVFTRITQRVPVRIRIEDEHPPLRPGALARVKIHASRAG